MMLLPILSAISVDCPALISFAKGLGMETDDPTRFLSLNTGDCCKSYDMQNSNGMSCQNERVLFIQWTGFLNGFINETALNLLTSLDHLEIECNALTGSAPSVYPSSITFMNFGSNYLTGPILSFPPNIQYLHLDNDYFSGAVPDIPDSLLDLRLDVNNAFTGIVHMYAPHELIASGQLISRVYIEDTSKFSLSAGFDGYGYCDISYTIVYRTQVDYLSNVCRINNIIANTECEVVQNIASDLGMKTVNISAYNTLNGTCCNGVGIKCDTYNHVTDINWGKMGLNGTLDTGKIELLYSYLQTFNISDNQINGSFTANFTSNILSLDLSDNLLSGSLGYMRLNKLQVLDISGNSFSGTFQNIPISVKLFDISFNYISGNISLNAPTVVNIKHNLVNDVIFAINNTLVYCNLQENALIRMDYPVICILDGKTSKYSKFRQTSALRKSSSSIRNVLTVYSITNTSELQQLNFLDAPFINTSDSSLFRMSMHLVINLAVFIKVIHSLYVRMLRKKQRKQATTKSQKSWLNSTSK